jgi:hypothetical protein
MLLRATTAVAQAVAAEAGIVDPTPLIEEERREDSR